MNFSDFQQAGGYYQTIEADGSVCMTLSVRSSGGNLIGTLKIRTPVPVGDDIEQLVSLMFGAAWIDPHGGNQG